eukprot:TRINITY_DN26730_c0_g1_i1.p2 TRINITY_DN26730_c0_g1~~TRINITY_DN26730_c0_g1_i1.p2  ORF type:complete len:248 (-),score=48.31 TRINITY_DN26730_c0_g1_i1:121-864(-)
MAAIDEIEAALEQLENSRRELDTVVPPPPGSEPTQAQDQPFTLYGYWRSSSSWRCRIALHLKQITYRPVCVHLAKGEQHSDEHAMRNVMEQVPVLELPNGQYLTQSMAIMEYLESVQPTPSLYPADPWLKAKAQQIAEIANSFCQPLQNLSSLKAVAAMGHDKVEWARTWITKGLVGIETELKQFSGAFCVGNEVTIADICLIPQLYGARRFGVDMSAFPLICQIEERCGLLGAFERAHCDVQEDAS